MKFKTKKDLKQAIIEYTDEMVRSNSGFPLAIYGLEKAFKSFTERIDFYQKYECTGPFKGGYSEHLEKVVKKNPELYHKFLKDITNEKGIFWNTWLFDYCFGGIE